MESKKYYQELDILRVISCLGVLFYHLGFLQGGFLSVCAFFVLSGYLSYVSLSHKEKVSLKEYYKNRFLHIYLPFIAVVFLSICVISFLPNIHWFNLKPESTSVLFGYNNYWQLSVNSDYFARHLNSPFMHFWYIAILLQFELIFPFVFLFIKTVKEKTHKVVPLIFLILLTFISTFYFYHISMDSNIMKCYYDTFARSFSIIMGLLVGYIHVEFHPLVFSKDNKISKVVFFGYLIIFILLQFMISADHLLFSWIMIVVSIISCRMIDYGVHSPRMELNSYQKVFQYLSRVSYEVYLFQYPILFLFQYTIIPENYRVPIMIPIIFMLSFFLHFCFDFKDLKHKYNRIVCCIVVSLFALYGLVQYVYAEDYTKDLDQLKEQLGENQKLLNEKQKEYEKRLKEEKEELDAALVDFQNGEEDLKIYVSQLPIVGIGDSVMLGAVPTLYQQFSNGYFDAAVSRTDYEAARILQDIKNRGLLSDNIVIHLGTNGQCGFACQSQILNICEGKNVYWLTVTNDYDVHVNESFYYLASQYSNVEVVDWASVQANHPEYVVADGIHLTGDGMVAYTNTIYQAIYQKYHKVYEEENNKKIKELEDKHNSKIGFYGNEVLLNIYPSLEKEFSSSNFKIQDSFDLIYQEFQNDVLNHTVNKRVLFVLDSKENLSLENYQKIISLSEGIDVTFVFVYHNAYSFSEENIHVIDFHPNLMIHDDYLMMDQEHLSNTGNQVLVGIIQSYYKEKKD